MAMDPKQERALRDGTASVADEPRDTDIESVREQAENPPVSERPRPRRRTAAVADVRVNQEAGTPVDQMAREFGAEPVPEMGRAPRKKQNGGRTAPETDPAGRENDLERGKRGAQATIDAQRGNQTATDAASPQLLDDERAEDRTPRDIPKSRDDRSAPKGNITAGQDDRNPNLETRDDQRPGPPSRAFSLDAARDAAAMPNAAPRPRPIAEPKRAAEKPKADRTPSMPKPRSRAVAKRTEPRPRAQEKTRGTTRRPTNLAKAKGPAVKRALAKRATGNRAAPKRATAKRAGTKRSGAAARKRATTKRPASRTKRKR